MLPHIRVGHRVKFTTIGIIGPPNCGGYLGQPDLEDLVSELSGVVRALAC